MLTVRRVLTVVLIGSIGCSSDAANVSAGPPTFDSLNAALDAAYRARDAASAAALFAPEARLELVDLPDIEGRDALRELLSTFFAANVVREFRLRADEVETYDSVAYERGVFRWDAQVGDTAVVQNGRYSLVRKRSPSGEWLIHRFIENLLPPN